MSLKKLVESARVKVFGGELEQGLYELRVNYETLIQEMDEKLQEIDEEVSDLENECEHYEGRAVTARNAGAEVKRDIAEYAAKTIDEYIAEHSEIPVDTSEVKNALFKFNAVVDTVAGQYIEESEELKERIDELDAENEDIVEMKGTYRNQLQEATIILTEGVRDILSGLNELYEVAAAEYDSRG